MRLILTVLMLLLSTRSLALGPDSWELFGVSKSGKTVSLKYGGYEMEQKHGGQFYVGPKHYGFCQPSASWEKGQLIEGEYLLLCSPHIGAKPNLIYKKDKDETKTAYYKTVKTICSKYFPGHETSQPGCGGYYRCIKGCSTAYVDLLVEITYGD